MLLLQKKEEQYGSLIYRAKGYDNNSKMVDRHSSVNGKMLQTALIFMRYIIL